MEKELIIAPIDNKNLMEDPFEDEVFGNFYAAPDHRTGGKRRHLIGHFKDDNWMDKGWNNYEAYVDVKWNYGDNSVDISVIAVPPQNDYDDTVAFVFDHYKKLFKSWECKDNPGLVVKTKKVLGILTVSFYFEVES